MYVVQRFNVRITLTKRIKQLVSRKSYFVSRNSYVPSEILSVKLFCSCAIEVKIKQRCSYNIKRKQKLPVCSAQKLFKILRFSRIVSKLIFRYVPRPANWNSRCLSMPIASLVYLTFTFACYENLSSLQTPQIRSVSVEILSECQTTLIRINRRVTQI